MSLPLEAFPDSHEAAYSAAISRAEGERALGSLAMHSNREYVWTFDGPEEQWHHHIAPHWETKEYEDGEFTGLKKGMSIPPKLMIPAYPFTSMYHIHPNETELIDHFEIKSQLPSNEDVDACAKLCILGYQDFRIVTPLGVTTMSVAPSVVESRSISINAFSLGAQQMCEWTNTKGVIGAVKLATEFYTRKFNNLIRVDFDPFLVV